MRRLARRASPDRTNEVERQHCLYIVENQQGFGSESLTIDKLFCP